MICSAHPRKYAIYRYPGSPKTKLCPLVVGNPLRFTCIILKTILCLVLDFQGIRFNCFHLRQLCVLCFCCLQYLIKFQFATDAVVIDLLGGGFRHVCFNQPILNKYVSIGWRLPTSCSLSPIHISNKFSLSQWPTFKLLGIPYSILQLNLKLLFHGSEWLSKN